MFLGHQSTKVDEKGRLKLSSDFKTIVDAQYGNKFYVTSVDAKRAQLYPLQEWLKKLEQVARIAQSNPMRQRFMDVTSRYGMEVEMDGQGRLLLPQELREEARLTGDVIVISKGTFLEVANGPEFREVAKPMTAEEMLALAELGL